MESTKLSSKGQVILPAAIRTARRWTPGTEFAVLETADGVLLKPKASPKPFVQTRLDDVFGMADYSGPVRSLEDMENAVLHEATKRSQRSPRR